MTSLKTGMLSTNCNTQEGKKQQVQNYRPGSLTSVVGKILETIIRDTIIQHMNNNDLLSNKQFGFIKGRVEGKKQR